VEIPKSIDLHQVGVVIGQHEIGVVIQKQIRHVVQSDQALQLGGPKFVLAAKLVTEQAGGLVQVMDQPGLARLRLRRVVIDDDPLRFVEPGLETQIANPGGPFARLALAPGVVMMGLERDIDIEKLSRQASEQNARQQAVQVAFMGEDHFRFGQRHHASEDS
jgi:hypothetical protein